MNLYKIVRKVFFCIVIGFLVIHPSIILAATLLYDDFSGNIVSSSTWYIPTWVSPTDGTFVGRTQFRCTQNSSLPATNDSNAIISVESYNPTGFSFYGTDLISNQSFPLEKGIHITVRAKMNTSTPGIVGGIFLYALKPGSTTFHDEIDFELLTNLPNGTQTNIYSNEPLGAGHPQFVSYTSGSITDYHTYEIKWQSNRVSWFIDGNLVRTDTSHVPAGPMNFHLNIWVPDSGWDEAYSPTLQPTTTASSNQVYWMSVDSVNIQSIPAPRVSDLTPILPLLLLDETP
jgi:beta-glucanase (GH16 family)